MAKTNILAWDDYRPDDILPLEDMLAKTPAIGTAVQGIDLLAENIVKVNDTILRVEQKVEAAVIHATSTTARAIRVGAKHAAAHTVDITIDTYKFIEESSKTLIASHLELKNAADAFDKAREYTNKIIVYDLFSDAIKDMKKPTPEITQREIKSDLPIDNSKPVAIYPQTRQDTGFRIVLKEDQAHPAGSIAYAGAPSAPAASIDEIVNVENPMRMATIGLGIAAALFITTPISYKMISTQMNATRNTANKIIETTKPSAKPKHHMIIPITSSTKYTRKEFGTDFEGITPHIAEVMTTYENGLSRLPNYIEPEKLTAVEKEYYPIIKKEVERNVKEYGLPNTQAFIEFYVAHQMAVFKKESEFNPLAISKSGAIGLGQLVPKDNIDLYEEDFYKIREENPHQYREILSEFRERLFDPEFNIKISVKRKFRDFAKQYKANNGNMLLATVLDDAKYNAGKYANNYLNEKIPENAENVHFYTSKIAGFTKHYFAAIRNSKLS